MNKGDQFNPALDGIRGIAFVMVLFAHANSYLSRPLFLCDGQVGVWLFFVLSAYLLARPFSEQPQLLKSGAVWGRYLTRRVLRIFPLYLLYVLAVGLAIQLPLGKMLSLFFLQEVHSVDWSIYVEFRFYLLLPLLMLPLGLGLPRRWYVLGLALFFLLLSLLFPFWQAHQTWPGAELSFSGLGGNLRFVSYLNCFLAGIILALLPVRECLKITDKNAVFAATGLTILTLLASLLLSYLRLFPEVIQLCPTDSLTYVWAPFAVLFALWLKAIDSAPPCVAIRILASTPLRFLGAISYPGYLFHLLTFWALNKYFTAYLGNAAFLAVALATVLLCAWLLHRFVEMPLYRLRPRR